MCYYSGNLNNCEFELPNFCGKKFTDFLIVAKIPRNKSSKEDRVWSMWTFYRSVRVGVNLHGSMWVGVNFLWVGVNILWLGVGLCEWVWHFYGLVWVGMGGCDLFMGRCGLVCDECDLFIGRCGLMWVGVTFLWVGVGWCGSERKII